MRRLEGGHDANGAVVTRPEMDRVLTLESPMQQGTWCLTMVPPAGRTTPQGAATIATDKGVSDGLHPTQHYACHTFLAKLVARSSSPPHRLHRKKPGTTRSTTTAPPA